MHLQSVANRAFLLPRAASRCTLNRIEVSIKVVRLYIFAMSLVVLTEAVLRHYFFAMRLWILEYIACQVVLDKGARDGSEPPGACDAPPINRIEVTIEVLRLYIFAMLLVVLTEAVLRHYFFAMSLVVLTEAVSQLYFFAMLVSDGDVPLVKNSAIMEFYKSSKHRKIYRSGIISKNFDRGSKFYRKKDMCAAHIFHFAG